MDIINKRVLVLAPHTDDGEFGCGGTIDRMIQNNCQVKYVAFSGCQESVPEPFPKNILEKEMLKATAILGIAPENIELKNYQVRKFNFSRQEILEDLVKIRKSYNPEVVFTPCTNDIHQDHKVVTEECIRAFKNTNILGYELPWNLLTLPSQLLIILDEENIRKKIKAIQAYQSQKFRIYAREEYIKSWATTRGVRIGKELAECFEVIRMIF